MGQRQCDCCIMIWFLVFMLVAERRRMERSDFAWFCFNILGFCKLPESMKFRNTRIFLIQTQQCHLLSWSFECSVSFIQLDNIFVSRLLTYLLKFSKRSREVVFWFWKVFKWLSWLKLNQKFFKRENIH